MRPRETAAQLGVCMGTLRRLVRRGAISPVQLGPRSIRYRASEISRLQRMGVA
ncbi:MAG: helix-turn-helix domain-containing protein [Myxococcales bacterium]|nr:helix-turn-helix domain-containing protein [Myxococcales bacterium]